MEQLTSFEQYLLENEFYTTPECLRTNIFPESDRSHIEVIKYLGFENLISVLKFINKHYIF
jgi:hypothetical protein